MGAKILVCGHCGRDFTNDPDWKKNTVKVVLFEFANLLCNACERELREKLWMLAKEYLVG